MNPSILGFFKPDLKKLNNIIFQLTSVCEKNENEQHGIIGAGGLF